jgi:hypothetical protein
VAAPVVVVAIVFAEAVYRYFLAPHTLDTTEATITVGATGGESNVLASFTDLLLLLPQLDVYNNLMLSPVTAAALSLYSTPIILDVSVPSVIESVADNTPVNDHK